MAADLDVGGGRRGRDDGRGSVVITSSCASMHNCTNVDLSSYAASKAATDHVVKLLAAKFARWYIRVNSINPGCESKSFSPKSFLILWVITDGHSVVVSSNMNPIGAEGNMFAALIDKVPAKRVGNMEDLAGTVIYLCSRAGVRKFSLLFVWPSFVNNIIVLC